ncbi:MAG TPA: glycosyltransferase family 2 protein, partial [Cytophagaceae bacterium]
MSEDSSNYREPYIEHPGPLLSIITVVFNSEKYIEGTLKSVISQTFKNFEIVIIDGGSTDQTLDIISSYRSKVHYLISEPDNGIYDAMNKGITVAKGEYLLFLNSGDQLNNDRVLEVIFSSLGAEDVIYGETNLIDGNGHVLGTRTELTTRKLPKALTWKHLKRGMVACHQSFIVKKRIAPYYQLKYKCSADIDWMIEALKRAKLIKNIQTPISKYLIGGFSGSNMTKCW